MRVILTIAVVSTIAAGCQGTSQIQLPAPGDDAPATVTPATTPSPPSATGDAARGRTRSGELYCDACHGPNGNSETAEWPSLAGQNAAYLARQLELLRSGERMSPEMQPMAAPLSDADIADLAAHYAAQALTPATAGGEESKIGESLYRDGDPARAIPACGSCHGPTGLGNPASGDPAVRAQQPGYSIRQLEAYAKHTRYASALQTQGSNASLEIMYHAAGKLTSEEIRSLATYLRTMP